MHPESEAETRPSADKLCFVISPIQQDDSEARIHADLVFKDLIEPAASKLEVLIPQMHSLPVIEIARQDGAAAEGA